jgi:hypothetical protein
MANEPWNTAEDIELVLRPLNKGIIRDMPSTNMVTGGAYNVENFVVNTDGLKRRPVTSFLFGSGEVDYPPVRGTATMYEADGTRHTVVWDEKFLYETSITGLIATYWIFNTGSGTVANSGIYVIGTDSEMGWKDSDVLYGDVFTFISPEGDSESHTILEVSGTNSLILATVPSTDYGASDYSVKKAFYKNPQKNLVDHAIVQNQIIFVDGRRVPTAYKGTSYGIYDSDITFSAEAVLYHKDRVWFSRIKDAGTDYRWRTMWSTVLDRTDFDLPIASSEQWLDIPYQSGRPIVSKGLGDMIVLYFTDAIWLLRRTNVGGDRLPYAPEKIETGGVGIAGTMAISSWIDGHFFVGTDDAYYFGIKTGLQPIGNKAIRDAIKSSTNIQYSYVTYDELTNSILFGIPSSGENIANIWVYNLKSKAWSIYPITCSMMAKADVVTEATWDSLDSVAGVPLTWDSGMQLFGTWDNISGVEYGDSLLFGKDGMLGEFTWSGLSDGDGSPVQTLFETGDFDLGAPNKKKLFKRISVKIKEAITEDLPFNVYASTDKGNNWKNVGTLAIPAGDDERAINFRRSGSTCRFRFVSSSSVSVYTIEEIVIMVRPRGGEIHFGPQD